MRISAITAGTQSLRRLQLRRLSPPVITRNTSPLLVGENPRYSPQRQQADGDGKRKRIGSEKEPESVTHVPGLKCYPCARLFKISKGSRVNRDSAERKPHRVRFSSENERYQFYHEANYRRDCYGDRCRRCELNVAARVWVVEEVCYILGNINKSSVYDKI